ncbi:MAG TPA: MFS transporter [Pseudonocardiaceae bacterium]|nr:MFS transporter [Pseudonocardiaceae bacterium]
MSTQAVPSAPPARPGSWAPLRIRVFRILWLAQLGSNIGTWMQTVAAQWLLVSAPHAAELVSLVQTASLLPVFFLSLPAGVLADIVDRRRLLYATTIAMALCVGVLALITGFGSISPALLLAFTFLVGCGSALTSPAWQAIQPDLVPHEQIPAAAALGSITVNGARAVGPALAGFLVAWVGPAPVFALNAISFLGIAAATLAWKQPRSARQHQAERMGEALSAGLRYLRSAPGVRRVILRSILFAAPASALWALLPVAADQRYHLNAAGYGLLLAALGIGAVAGVVVLSWLRRRMAANLILALSAVVFGLATAALAYLPVVITAVALAVAGVAWIATLSSLNAGMQVALPAWVRARGMAAYILAFMGAQAVGSTIWGLVAADTSLSLTLTISAVLLVVVGATVPLLPVHARTARLDRTVVSDWPSPTLVFEPAPSDGPVLVVITYQVAAPDVAEFLAAAHELERARRRTGAGRWRLYRDGAAVDRYLETFSVASWAEHLRQHDERWTASDRELDERVKAIAVGAPDVRHLLPAEVLRTDQPES